MNRKDSGFVESRASRTSHELHRSDASTNAPRKPYITPTDSLAGAKPTPMDFERPVSERRSKPVRQTSTTSSGDSTTKSKGRSKPSSRRTSCNIVDPSRPARHYRIQSTHSTPVTTSQDVDDVLALHFRSCSLFTNPSYHTNSGLPSPTLSQRPASMRPGGPTRFSLDDARTIHEQETPEQSQETITAMQKTNTTMHWTSPCSRKREYERIDRANSGLRGLFRKVVPRSLSGPQERFYEKGQDRSDAGSVRRYRIDSEDDPTASEKSSTRHQTQREGRPGTHQRKTSWACF